MPRKNSIQIRRGTSQQWACDNPILGSGEPGMETDTLKFKIGNGTSPWNDLVYVSYDGGDLDSNVIPLASGSFTSQNGTVIQLTDYFDPSKPALTYNGVTGGKIKVPQGFNYAIYIDSSGNVVQESVSPGQQLTFKSEIVL